MKLERYFSIFLILIETKKDTAKKRNGILATLAY